MVSLRIKKQILSLLAIYLIPLISTATTYTVSSNADDGSIGTLRYAITQLNASGTTGSAATNNTININSSLSTITLLSNLPVIQRGVTINGPSALQTVSGNNTYRIFATYGASLTLSNLTLSQGLNQGGAGSNGGGGGMGAGSGVLVDYGQTLSLSNTTIQNCTAQGGAGATLGIGGGGGGGAGWTIGTSAASSSQGGGDYPGVGITGGGSAYAAILSGYGGGDGGAGIGSGTAGVGGGDSSGLAANTNNGGDGGYCGGGGGASDTTNNSAGGGGGNGGGNGNAGTYSGGGGGGYGSGGSGVVGTDTFGGGGGGGLGGGGGAGGLTNVNGAEGGGGGGFGGGGGSGTEAGKGGNFGGDGVANNVGGGGGGLGGAIFVGDSAIMKIGNGVTLTSNNATGGIGGNNGTGYANDIFLFQGASLQFVGSSALTASFAIQADPNATVGHLDAGVLINPTNSAVITFSANNYTYQGGTSIQAGTLKVSTGALPTTGDVTIGSGGILTLMANSVATTGNFSNEGALNIEATFTPSDYTSFTNTGKVYAVGTGAVGGSVTANGSLNIGQDSSGTTNANSFTTSNTIIFDQINIYNTSSLATSGGGTVTADLYMLGTSTFSGNNISGSILTTGQDSFGNNVSSTAFSASQAISTFPTINVKAGTFTTNGFGISNVDTAFSISSGATSTFDAVVSGLATLNIAGTLNSSVTDSIGLTGLITIGGTLNVLENLALANTINCSGSIATSTGKTLTINGDLYAYNSASLSGPISGGGASSLIIGLDSLGNTYSSTNASISSDITGVQSLNVASGSLTTSGIITGLDTAFDIASGATATFNAAVTGAVAASNAGTLITSATLTVDSYANTGTTRFVITDATTTGNVAATGAVTFGANPLEVRSNFITPIAGNNYQWIIATGAAVTAPVSQILPANTVANTWSLVPTATDITVLLQKSALNASNLIIGPIINSMSVSPANTNQFILIDALGKAVDQNQLYNYVNKLIPELNSSVVNVAKQNAIFRQVGHRISTVRDNLAHYHTAGYVAGDIDAHKSMWIGPFGSIANQGPTTNNFGYKAYSGGVIIGGDLKLSNRSLIGVAIARSNTLIQTKLDNGLRSRSIGYHTMLYGDHLFGRRNAHFVEWMASLGINLNRGNREILMSGYDLTTQARYNNYQAGFLLNYGKNCEFNSSINFAPIGTIQYNLVNTPPYSESSDSAAGLRVTNRRISNVLTIGIGARSSFKHITPKVEARYSVGAVLGYDVVSSSQAVTAQFLSGGSAFTYISYPSRISLNLDANCTFDLHYNTTLQLGYELQFRQGYISNAATAKIKYII